MHTDRHIRLDSFSIWAFASAALLPSLLLANRDCRSDSSSEPISTAVRFGRREPGESSPGQRCTAGFHSPVRRKAAASDAYTRGGEAWRVLPDARKPAELSKQGAACMDWSLDLSGCADL